MRNLSLNFMIIIFTALIICSCQKETINDSINGSALIQKENFDLEEVEANALQYRALTEKSLEKIEGKLQIIKQNIEKLKADRSRRFKNSGITSQSRNGVINVPKDYPTLQEAVDNSQPGGKIHIKGTVNETSEVLIDVPGLTIQGTGSSPTIIGTTLTITVEDITVQNLSLDMAIVISGTSNAKIRNNHISATNNVGAVGPVSLLNSNNNTIKNCTINGAYSGGTYAFGLFLDNLSTHNEIDNCTAENATESTFEIAGQNNTLKNCTALNFVRGFSTITTSSNINNNQFIGCVANTSIADAGFVFFIPGNSNLLFKNCTANNNTNFGFFIFGGSATVSNCTANSNPTGGSLIIFTDVLVKKSNFNNNGEIGMYLFGVNNSLINKNKATNNPICDFNQTNSSGNTVTKNKFGTTCNGL